MIRKICRITIICGIYIPYKYIHINPDLRGGRRAGNVMLSVLYWNFFRLCPLWPFCVVTDVFPQDIPEYHFWVFRDNYVFSAITERDCKWTTKPKPQVNSSMYRGLCFIRMKPSPTGCLYKGKRGYCITLSWSSLLSCVIHIRLNNKTKYVYVWSLAVICVG